MSIKLDQTYIAVRQRSILETFDLSLQIARDHFFQLVGALFLGAFPWMLIDFLIVYRWAAADQFWFGTALLAILIVAQAPMGTVVITDFLGSVMFKRRANVFKSTRNTYKAIGKFIWLHGFIRMAIPITVLAAVAMPDWDDEVKLGYFTLLLPSMIAIALLVRGLRPFSTEVVLLEKPDWKGGSEKLTFARRTQALHGPAAAELFGKALVSFLFAAGLAVCFYFLFYSRKYLTGFEPTTFDSLVIFTPLTFWFAAAFVTVARFLSYIDLRIRQEGWEVELKLRAEANKYHEKSLK